MKETILMKKNSGFTLLELMIATAIITILVAVSVPSVTRWRENSQLDRAARAVYSDFQRAKLEAVKRNLWCSLSFTAGSGYTVFVDANNSRTYDGGDPVLGNRLWSAYGTAGEQAGGNTFIGTPIFFAGDGLPRQAGGALGAGSIALENSLGNVTSVRVSFAGTIRIVP